MLAHQLRTSMRMIELAAILFERTPLNSTLESRCNLTELTCVAMIYPDFQRWLNVLTVKKLKFMFLLLENMFSSLIY